MSKLLIQYVELKDNLQRYFGEKNEYKFTGALDDVKLTKFLCSMPIPKELEGDLLAVHTGLFYKRYKERKGGLAVPKENFDESKEVEGLVQLIFANGIVHQVKETINHLESKKKVKK